MLCILEVRFDVAACMLGRTGGVYFACAYVVPRSMRNIRRRRGMRIKYLLLLVEGQRGWEALVKQNEMHRHVPASQPASNAYHSVLTPCSFPLH